jgi:hypothetical protein
MKAIFLSFPFICFRPLEPNRSRALEASWGLEHARQHPVGWPVAVDEGANVDDHLLAHVGAALVRR